MKIAKKCPVKTTIFSPSKIANHNKRPLPFVNNIPTLIYANTSDKGGNIEYYFSIGTYGTNRQRILNSIHNLELEGSRHAKAKYIF